MASNISVEQIDVNFPIAGQDNDSQGFRDNFNIIENNFVEARGEINALQANTILKGPLASGDVIDNNFNNETIYRYVAKEQSLTHTNRLSGISADAELSFQSGHYFTITAQANITLTINGWPTNDEYAELYIHVYGDGGATRTVTFASEYGASQSSLMQVDASFGGSPQITTTLASNDSTLIKAFTYNNGGKVFLQNLGAYSQVWCILYKKILQNILTQF